MQQIIRVEFIVNNDSRPHAETALYETLAAAQAQGAFTSFHLLPEQAPEEHGANLAARMRWVQQIVDSYARQQGRITDMNVGFDLIEGGRLVPRVHIEMEPQQ